MGGDSLISKAAQALVKTSCSPDTLHFALIPTGESVGFSLSLSLSLSHTHTHTLSIPLLYLTIFSLSDPGLMSTRLSSLDGDYYSTFLPGSQWLEALQDSVDSLLDYVRGASHCLPLPLAQASLQRPTGESR